MPTWKVLLVALGCAEAEVPEPGQVAGQVAGVSRERGSCRADEDCAGRMICTDIADQCKPGQSEQPCPGVCRTCDDPALNRTYVDESPRSCQRIRLHCLSEQRPFSDLCGCGCERVANPD